MTATTSRYEQQRFEHLVLGRARPKSAKPRGRKLKKPAIVPLEPGIEGPVALREAWSHKAQGTPQTHEHAQAEAGREGALARLHRSQAIDDHQLAAAHEIATINARIAADVAVRTASWGRVDAGRRGGEAEESAGRIMLEQRYSRWRAWLGGNSGVVLAMIVDDVGVTAAAARGGMHPRRAKRLLVAALNGWLRGAGPID